MTVDALQLVEASDAPAVATDQNMCVLKYNRPAELLLEFGGRAILGQGFFETVSAHDVFGNRLASKPYTLKEMLKSGELLHPFEIDVGSESAKRTRVAISPLIILSPEPDTHRIVYLMTPRGRRQTDRTPRRTKTNGTHVHHGCEDEIVHATTSSTVAALTPRETQIMHLLSEAANTAEIAASLSLSRNTVRNHIQNVLQKLNAHSRLQAVRLAREQGILA